MLNLLFSLLTLLRSSFKTRLALQLEIVALRHQLGILQRSFERKRPRFQNSDRLLWVWLLGSGRGGGKPWSLFDRKRWLLGIGWAFGCTGDGRVELGGPGGPPFRKKFGT